MLRTLHKRMGMLFAPFFLLTALTGVALLWRKAGVYEGDAQSLFIGLHNWEILAKYIGVILAAGLTFMTATGFSIAMRSRRKKS